MRCTRYDSYRYRHSWCVYRCPHSLVAATLSKNQQFYRIHNFPTRSFSWVFIYHFFCCSVLLARCFVGHTVCIGGVFIYYTLCVDWKYIYIYIHTLINSKSHHIVCCFVLFCFIRGGRVFKILFLAWLFSVKYTKVIIIIEKSDSIFILFKKRKTKKKIKRNKNKLLHVRSAVSFFSVSVVFWNCVCLCEYECAFVLVYQKSHSVLQKVSNGRGFLSIPLKKSNHQQFEIWSKLQKNKEK